MVNIPLFIGFHTSPGGAGFESSTVFHSFFIQCKIQETHLAAVCFLTIRGPKGMSFGIRNVPDRTKVGGVGDVGIQEVHLCFFVYFSKNGVVSDHQSLRVVFFSEPFWGGGFCKNSSNLHVARTLDGFFGGIRTKSLGFFHEDEGRIEISSP